MDGDLFLLTYLVYKMAAIMRFAVTAEILHFSGQQGAIIPI